LATPQSFLIAAKISPVSAQDPVLAASFNSAIHSYTLILYAAQLNSVICETADGSFTLVFV
jgi:hypothetical protein